MANRLGLTVSNLRNSTNEDLGTEDQAWLQYLLDKSVRRLFGMPQCRGLRQRVETGTEEFTDLVKDVVLDAVMRLLRNPSGMETEQEGNYSYKFNKLVASGNLWFPDNDLALIGCGTVFVPRTGRVSATHGWSRL